MAVRVWRLDLGALIDLLFIRSIDLNHGANIVGLVEKIS